jgi:hypothetical protein
MMLKVPGDGCVEFGLSLAVKMLIEIDRIFTDQAYTVGVNIAYLPVQTSIECTDTIVLLMAVLIIL